MHNLQVLPFEMDCDSPLFDCPPDWNWWPVVAVQQPHSSGRELSSSVPGHQPELVVEQFLAEAMKVLIEAD